MTGVTATVARRTSPETRTRARPLSHDAGTLVDDSRLSLPKEPHEAGRHLEAAPPGSPRLPSNPLPWPSLKAQHRLECPETSSLPTLPVPELGPWHDLLLHLRSRDLVLTQTDSGDGEHKGRFSSTS